MTISAIRVPDTDEEPAMSAVDLRPILDGGSWTGFQKMVLVLCSSAVILDGFDNQVLGFAMPALLKEWGLSKSDFVPILTFGLIAMCFGTVVAGILADRFGRKPILIGTIMLFSLATSATALIGDLSSLTALRLLAMFGIGGAIPVATSLLSDFVPKHRRSLAVSIGMLCVPVGGLIGGLIAASVLPNYGWRPLFVVGGLMPLAIAAAMLWVLPESPIYLARRPKRRPELLTILRRSPGFVDRGTPFFDGAAEQVTVSARVLIEPALRRNTLCLWGAFFCSLFANYLIFNWAPTMLSGAGYDLATASRGLAAYNFGGIGGALAGSWLMDRYGSRMPLMGVSAAGTILGAILFVAISAFALGPATIILAFGLQGIFTAGFQVMLFALAVNIYPSTIRGTGLGFALAIGRSGAVAGAAAGASILGLGNGAFFAGVALAMGGGAVAVAAARGHFRQSARVEKANLA